MSIIYTMLFCTVLITTLFFCICHTNADKNKTIMDSELSDKMKKMGTNVQIVGSMLKFIGNDTTTVVENKDEKAQMSFYQPSQNRIVIKPTEDFSDCGRLVHIAHECVHSIQPKKLLMTHFILSNINLLYFLGIFAGFFYLKDIEKRVLLLVIQLILFAGVMFVKMLLESDAIYRSTDVATEFLKGKVSDECISNFEKKAKTELYPMLPNFYFTLFFQNAVLLILAQVGALYL